ncbi:MAG: inositol monophosphatase family protein, partial [Mucilaginibacter sp.]
MNLEEIVKGTVDISREVGDFIRQERKTFSTDKIEYKGLNDMVSYVDKTAEERLVAGLEKILPEAGFITEEKTSTRIGERYNWIIDPLDGTTNFIHGMPLFAVSIALKEYDELVAGVIYEINMDECFYAWKGAPAYLNGTEIKVSNTPTVGKS